MFCASIFGREVPRRQLLHERFTVVTTLGRGAFGEVLLVEDRFSQGSFSVVKRAVATPSCGSERLSELIAPLRAALTEAWVMSRFHDDGIVRLHEVWHEARDDSLCLRMEYFSGGDLEAYVRRAYPIPESALRAVLAQCLLAVAHMHAKDVVHRDLKTSNILVRADAAVPRVALADFGLSAVWSAAEPPAACVGTPLFMSPETLTAGRCGFGSDVWSLGVVFYRLLTNRHPFRADGLDALRRRVVSGEAPHPNALPGVDYAPALGDAVMRMLSPHPRWRPTARALLAAPVFANALRASLWRGPRLRGAMCRVVCASVCIRAAPLPDAAPVAVVGAGDHVWVAGGGGAWVRVVAPREGFCATHWRGARVLQYVGDPAPHTDAPAETNGGEAVAPKTTKGPVRKILRAIFGAQNG